MTETVLLFQLAPLLFELAGFVVITCGALKTHFAFKSMRRQEAKAEAYQDLANKAPVDELQSLETYLNIGNSKDISASLRSAFSQAAVYYDMANDHQASVLREQRKAVDREASFLLWGSLLVVAGMLLQLGSLLFLPVPQPNVVLKWVGWSG